MMKAATQQAYREVLKLVRKLPPPTRSYYTQYARENFVTYSEAEDPAAIRSLLLRAHHHTCWVLKKVRVHLLNIESLVKKGKTYCWRKYLWILRCFALPRASCHHLATL
jgi:hypothetical protein